MTTCRICHGPLTAVSDDPDLSHPSCAPSDPERFEAATHGPRTYRGAMAAFHHSLCRGCGSRIEVGERQVLADIDGRRVWACAACADSRPSKPPQSAATVVPRPRTSPGAHSPNQPLIVNAPRRAAA